MKGTVVNQTLPSMHIGPLGIMIKQGYPQILRL